jgi:bacillithiol biosynthesis cysteine-adding enzyme BshC
MQSTQVPLTETHAFSGLFLDYLNEKPELAAYYGLFPKIENFAEQISLRQTFPTRNRQTLAEALHRQYQNIAKPPKDQIDLLLDNRTFTVTTGHQLCLFTGPLYFIFKIITTIRLAEELKKKYPQCNFVPVYWMASEDHDFAEVNHFHLFNQSYTWLSEQKGAVGRFKLEGLAAVFAQISEKLPDFEAAYLQSENLTEATRKLVHHFFGEYGLICIDGDDTELKKMFRPIVQDDILNQNAFKLVNQTNEDLITKGYKVQVSPREINFFYLDNQIRERIVKEGTEYKVLHTDLSFSEAEILNLLDTKPTHFSPNVVMRPVYQELILPNLAYIGGPGELAYWLELKSTFEHYQVPFPILQPRNFGMIVNKNQAKKVEKLGITPQDLFQPDGILKETLLEHSGNALPTLNAEIKTIEDIFNQITRKAVETDKTLEGFIGAEAQKTLKSLENIEKRLRKAQETKAETELKQLSQLKERLFPQGGLQERWDNFLNFYLNQSDFLATLHRGLNPFAFQMHIFTEAG